MDALTKGYVDISKLVVEYINDMYKKYEDDELDANEFRALLVAGLKDKIRELEG